MSDPNIGAIEWRDLTIDNAEQVKNFYQDVVGWKTEPVSMGDYDDFNMMDAEGNTVAGVCHARGSNAGLPPQWLMYVRVADVDSSATTCEESGGEVVYGPRDMGKDRFCVIRDPAGAVLALYGSGKPA